MLLPQRDTSMPVIEPSDGGGGSTRAEMGEAVVEAVGSGSGSATSKRAKDEGVGVVEGKRRLRYEQGLMIDVTGASAGDDSFVRPETDTPVDEQTLKKRMRRAPEWAATVNNIAFMCVPRAIPACMASTGWLLGIFALAYSSLVTFDTGVLLGKVCNMRPNLGSFPELTGEAFAVWRERRGDSRSRCETWRAFARRGTLALQFATYYLTAVAELIYFEQFCGQLFQRSGICQWQWLLIVSAVSLPVLQVPTFNESRWVAVVLGVLPLILNVAVMFYEIWLVQPWSCTPGPAFQPPTVTSAFIGFTAFAYAFGGHGIYPEEIREMQKPSAWPRVMSWTYAVALPLYWSCGILGYAAYGDFSKANINLNFPENNANTLSLAVQLVQEVYFILSSNLVLLLAIELALKVDPSAHLRPRWKGMPPVLVRFFLRTLFFASQVLLAQMLLAGEGDTLLALQSLIGAVGMTAFTYFLPYVLYVLLSPERIPRPYLAWSMTNVVVGIIVMVVGLYSSVQELTRSSAGLFAGSCEVEYAYAPMDPEDPCFLSGLPPGATGGYPQVDTHPSPLPRKF